MSKNNLYLGIIFVMFLISFISGVGEVSYCCEKTNSGAWCQNAPVANCDKDFRKAPTSCESTSYCRMGCCYNSQEGTCMENSPQKVCEDSEGVWEDDAQCDVPQCELGCCLIGDQAAFVTQTRCKRLSSLYGLEINFRTDMGNEIMCILSATSETKGACVFEQEFEKTCLFISQKECSDMEAGGKYLDVGFHKDYLCSAETLSTNCGPTEQTTCVEGRDEVYYIDSCGNLANIYDSAKQEDKEYWSKIYAKSENCNPNSGNVGSANCGSCDYYLGSTCKKYERNRDKVKPNFGDNICRDLSCTYEGKKYSHGETWCANVKGVSKITINSETGNIKTTGTDLPGGRYFRLVCYNGDVSVEPCADFRQEVCIQSDIGGFKTAACRANQWQDGIDRSDGDATPGFDFWNTEGDAQQICAQGNAECIVEFEKKLGGDKECVKNCNCLDAGWKSSMNKQCIEIGDCGESKNYLGY